MESIVHIMLGNALTTTVLAGLVVAVRWACRRPAVIHCLCVLILLKLITPPLVDMSVPLRAFASTWVPTPPQKERVDASGPPSEPLLRVHASERAVRVPPHHSASLRELDTAPEEAARTEPPNEIALATEVIAGGRQKTAAGPAAFRASTIAWWGEQLSAWKGWHWERPVFILILAGAASWWLLLAIRAVRFRTMLREAQPVRDEWQAQIRELARGLGLRKAPVVYQVPGRLPPLIWAIGARPWLLVPRELWVAFGEDERKSLLIHELAHLKRRDHWVRWLELLASGLYWWHPVLWWVRRALREAEEQCCDAWVVWAMPRGARTYAVALLTALEFVSGARAVPATASATGGNGHVSCLRRRLRMILRAKTPKGLSRAGRLAVMGLAALLLPLGLGWAHDDTGVPTQANLASAGEQLSEPLAVAQAVPRSEQEAEEALPGSPEARVTEDLTSRILKDLFDLEFRSDVDQARSGDDDDDQDDKGGDLAERIEKHVRDLVNKVADQFGPAGEEARKALERAVAELHRALQKEELSGDDIQRALERAGEELRRSFQQGGPVDRELREGLERSRKELRDALEGARKDVDRSRQELRSRAEEARKRLREQAKKGQEERDRRQAERDQRRALEGPAAQEREELEAVRKEIRDLGEQLRRATRRLDELQRRETRRSAAGRRPAGQPVEPPPPRERGAPAAKAAPLPPAAPAPANARRPRTPPRGPQAEGRGVGPRRDRDRDFREIEEKLNRLMKELENLKGERRDGQGKESSSPGARPPRRGVRTDV